jgi:hypothetical protein
MIGLPLLVCLVLTPLRGHGFVAKPSCNGHVTTTHYKRLDLASRWSKRRSSDEEDEDTTETKDTASTSTAIDISLQQDINELITPGGSSGHENNSSKEIDETETAVYNTIPLFTGSIVTLLSLAGTLYLYYVGLTGDDPLMGHPK